MTRIVLFILLLAVVPREDAFAQPPGGLADAQGRPVSLIDLDRREWQGRLLKVSAEALEIETEGGVRLFQLANVQRVDADGDGVGDGAVKGAIFGAVLGLLAIQNEGDARFVLAGALVYGAIGAGIDALNTCRHTVYRAPAKQVALTLRW